MAKDITTRGKILRAICLTGRYPQAQYALIADESSTVNTVYRVMLDMNAEREIKISWQGGYAKKTRGATPKPKTSKDGAEKTVRLNTRVKRENGLSIIEKELSELLGDEALAHYLDVTDKSTKCGSSTAIMRDLRMAEIMMVLMQAGASVLSFEKPLLKTLEKPFVNHRVFYDSLEIKRAEITPSEKYARSRFYGMYYSPGGAYMVYNFKNNNMQLTAGRELSAKYAMNEITASVWKPENTSLASASMAITDSLFFGHDDYELIDRLMWKNKNPFSEICDVFTNIYYVPVQREGIFQVWMLSQPYWKQRIVEGFIESKYVDKDKKYRTHDAYIPEEDLHVLCWLDANMIRLRVLTSELSRNRGQKFVVMHFAWQKPILEKFLGNKVQYLLVAESKVQGMLMKGG